MNHLTVAVLTLALTGGAHAQVVQIGPPDPHFCETIERIKPNLILKAQTRVSGRITDQSTAPSQQSFVELRRYFSEEKQVSVKRVKTDADGAFDLGLVGPGTFRLLASPTRAFRQPDSLVCPSDGRCHLDIELKVNPTDMPESTCPVR
jgi:hypothetical protein